MIVQTYQSKLVLKILHSGQVYWAQPNLSLKGEYAALIDLLGLRCACPIFGVVKGRRQNTGGKASGAVQLTLDVPDDRVYLTEYEEWADFLYAYKFTKPGNYKALRPDCEEITIRRYAELLENLKCQKKPSDYQCPQVILEKIDPRWLKGVKFTGKGGLLSFLFKR